MHESTVMCVRACVRACVSACGRTCVRACVRACVCGCVCACAHTCFVRAYSMCTCVYQMTLMKTHIELMNYNINLSS